MNTISPNERQLCHEAAVNSFATAYIFEQRTRPLARAQMLIAFSSLAGPVSIGVLVTSVDITSKIIPTAVWIAATISTIQFAASFWGLFAKWSDNLAYYVESKADNYYLADKFKALRDNTALSNSKWQNEFKVLETQGDFRSRLDHRIGVTDEEKRMGMRAGLREFSVECVACSQTPTSMVGSTCAVCGNFKKRYFKWLT